MRQTFLLFKKIRQYIMGNIYARLLYDRQYLSSNYFQRWNSPGWEWTVADYHARRNDDANRNVPWPVSPFSCVNHFENVRFDISSLNVFHSKGCYFQARDSEIIIGKHCWIANNVGIVTSNHDILNVDLHKKGERVVIGDYCWIGMNSVILPGVSLGDHTVVAAGAVVNKSFDEGYCVIGGVPAKKIKTIERS